MSWLDADPRQYLIAAYFEGSAYFLSPGASPSRSVFGGPAPKAVRGIPGTTFQPERLHYLGRVDSTDMPALKPFATGIPLFYGFTFDGCTLSYALDESEDIDLMDLTPPRAMSGFPYAEYPAVLPSIPLRLGRAERMPYGRFAEAFPNL